MDKEDLLHLYAGMAMMGLIARDSKYMPLTRIPSVSVEMAKSLIHELEMEIGKNRPQQGS